MRTYPDVQNQVPHRPLSLGHAPVFDGNLRHLEAWARPLWQRSLVHLLEASRIRMNRFFLQVGHEPVADPRRHQIGDEHGVVEDALRGKDHQAHQPARLVEVEEGQQVHPLVVRLFEQRLDPSLVGLEPSERVQVADRAGDCARDARQRLQENKPDELL